MTDSFSDLPDISVEYVWHDCFVVSLPGLNMVFDYWRPPTDESPDSKMPKAVAALDRNVPLWVFVSHGHKDHYNPDIWAWSETFERVEYVVSFDVWQRIRHIVSLRPGYKGPRVPAEHVHLLKPGREFCSDGVKVRACGSTDIGNSYLIEACRRIIFHAGDLNAWIWLDESTDDEVADAIADFCVCVEEIKCALDGRCIDICFFPVDKRLGRAHDLGARIFRRLIPIRHFFPMHACLSPQ